MKKVLKIAEEYKVRVLSEEELPAERITILRCGEERGIGVGASTVFTEFKRKKLFESRNQ